MKKFSIALAATLALASAAPAFADTKTNDDPFVSTQNPGSGPLVGLGGAGAAAGIIAAISIVAIIAAGDS